MINPRLHLFLVYLLNSHNHPTQLAGYLHVEKVLNFNLITGFSEEKTRSLCSRAALHSSPRGRKIASKKRGEWYLINYWFLLNYSRQAIIDIDGTDISLCLVPKWKEISHPAICCLDREMLGIFNFKRKWLLGLVYSMLPQLNRYFSECKQNRTHVYFPNGQKPKQNKIHQDLNLWPCAWGPYFIAADVGMTKNDCQITIIWVQSNPPTEKQLVCLMPLIRVTLPGVPAFQTWTINQCRLYQRMMDLPSMSPWNVEQCSHTGLCLGKFIISSTDTQCHLPSTIHTQDRSILMFVGEDKAPLQGNMSIEHD